LIGLLAQIYKNYTRKSCKGLAPILIYAAGLRYTLWGLYSWLKPDRFLAIAQIPECILVFQLWWYRKKEI